MTAAATTQVATPFQPTATIATVAASPAAQLSHQHAQQRLHAPVPATKQQLLLQELQPLRQGSFSQPCSDSFTVPRQVSFQRQQQLDQRSDMSATPASNVVTLMPQQPNIDQQTSFQQRQQLDQRSDMSATPASNVVTLMPQQPNIDQQTSFQQRQQLDQRSDMSATPASNVVTLMPQQPNIDQQTSFQQRQQLDQRSDMSATPASNVVTLMPQQPNIDQPHDLSAQLPQAWPLQTQPQLREPVTKASQRRLISVPVSPVRLGKEPDMETRSPAVAASESRNDPGWAGNGSLSVPPPPPVRTPPGASSSGICEKGQSSNSLQRLKRLEEDLDLARKLNLEIPESLLKRIDMLRKQSALVSELRQRGNDRVSELRQRQNHDPLRSRGSEAPDRAAIGACVRSGSVPTSSRLPTRWRDECLETSLQLGGSGPLPRQLVFSPANVQQLPVEEERRLQKQAAALSFDADISLEREVRRPLQEVQALLLALRADQQAMREEQRQQLLRLEEQEELQLQSQQEQALRFEETLLAQSSLREELLNSELQELEREEQKLEKQSLDLQRQASEMRSQEQPGEVAQSGIHRYGLEPSSNADRLSSSGDARQQFELQGVREQLELQQQVMRQEQQEVLRAQEEHMREQWKQQEQAFQLMQKERFAEEEKLFRIQLAQQEQQLEQDQQRCEQQDQQLRQQFEQQEYLWQEQQALLRQQQQELEQREEQLREERHALLEQHEQRLQELQLRERRQEPQAAAQQASQWNSIYSGIDTAQVDIALQSPANVAMEVHNGQPQQLRMEEGPLWHSRHLQVQLPSQQPIQQEDVARGGSAAQARDSPSLQVSSCYGGGVTYDVQQLAFAEPVTFMAPAEAAKHEDLLSAALEAAASSEDTTQPSAVLSELPPPELPSGVDLEALPQVYRAAICIIMEHGWDALHGGEDGGPAWTALHWAASEGRKDLCELLLSCRADAGHKDETGKTPFDFASANGHTATAVLLAGATTQASWSQKLQPSHRADEEDLAEGLSLASEIGRAHV
eukprot:TRINITY_DN3127_c0_g1_i6.p1 TRINITY_DN3127_c0_g1~~TRINITY_DN3127_c0_g1_i6.p1  ORF type:complete len:1115 (+),score=267.57 TRINITY_DN3127_c0_g1_i6:272-3346(+)